MLKVYQIRDQEVSEDAAIFAEAWYETLEDLYGSFSEFMTDMVRKGTYPCRGGSRSEKVSRLLKERGCANSHTIDIPREQYKDLEKLAEEKSLTVDEYVSEKILAHMKVKPGEWEGSGTCGAGGQGRV